MKVTKSRQKQGFQPLNQENYTGWNTHLCGGFSEGHTPVCLNETAVIQTESYSYHLEVSKNRIWTLRVSEREGRYPRNEGSTGGLALTYVFKLLSNSWPTLNYIYTGENLSTQWKATVEELKIRTRISTAPYGSEGGLESETHRGEEAGQTPQDFLWKHRKATLQE